MPQESFHSMQEDWKLEIQQMFSELRTKEKVREWSHHTVQAWSLHSTHVVTTQYMYVYTIVHTWSMYNIYMLTAQYIYVHITVHR